MSSPLTFKSLKPAEQRLVALMQWLNYGRLEALIVRNGQPVFNPPPSILREVKFGADNTPRPELGQDDFVLKEQVVELIEELRRMSHGVVRSLTVKGGLPFNMAVVTPPSNVAA
jgi:hypothetical protein